MHLLTMYTLRCSDVDRSFKKKTEDSEEFVGIKIKHDKMKGALCCYGASLDGDRVLGVNTSNTRFCI